MHNATRFGSFAIALAFAGAVIAQAPGAGSPPAQGSTAPVEFSSVDTNKDGRVSTEEAQAHSELRAAFPTLDANRDSQLSKDEFSQWNRAGKAGGSEPAAPRSEAEGQSAEQPQAEAQPQAESQSSEAE